MKKNPKKLIIIMTLITTLGIFGFTRLNSQVIRVSESAKLEKSLKKVEAKVYINAPIEKVWLIIGKNFDQNYKFSVDGKETFYLKEVDGMIGSQRRTVNHKGKVIDVEVVEYNPEATHVKWEIFNMNVAPLKAGNSSYTLHEDGEGGTILVQKAAFKMKIFFMDWIAKGKFTTLFKTQLAAIKHLSETGESITPQTKDEIVQRYSDAIKIIK
jgi:hypothetical protein